MTVAFNLTVRVQLALNTMAILSSGTPPHHFQVPGSSQLPTTSLLISFKLTCQRLSQYKSMPTKSRPLLFIFSHSNEFGSQLYSSTHLKSVQDQQECFRFHFKVTELYSFKLKIEPFLNRFQILQF